MAVVHTARKAVEYCNVKIDLMGKCGDLRLNWLRIMSLGGFCY
jgi:hypothetical protein